MTCVPSLPIIQLAAEQMRDTAYIEIDGRIYTIVRDGDTWTTVEPVMHGGTITIPAGIPGLSAPPPTP